jgi:IS5 family transposase
MQGQGGFWDVEDWLKELSTEGDPLEKLAATVDFVMFRPALRKALGRCSGGKGGRPGFDPVLKFKMLVLQALHGLSLAQTNYMVRDRLSWMRFCGLGPGDSVPDANTLWDFREALIAARALEKAFELLDRTISAAGYLPMGGQIIDATLVAAPKQRNTDGEKAALKAGQVPAEWKDNPARLRQKDRGTVKFAKAKPKEDREPQIDIAIPFYGYENHISIDRRHGLIRRRLREGLIDQANAASEVWADPVYRSAANEAFLARAGKISRIHHKKPKGRPMPKPLARGNATKSRIRVRIEHVFAEQKDRMKLFIRTIGLARAEATVTLANMAFNMKRWCWLNGRSVPA